MFDDVGTVRGAITLSLMVIGAVGMAYAGVIVPLRHQPKPQPGASRPPPAPVPSAAREARTMLERWEIVVILALCVAVFVGLIGPAWEGSYDVDRAVALSYLPIPPLVLACLLYRGRFRLRSFVVGSFVLACAKFAITALLVITALAVWGPSERSSTPPTRVAKVFARVESPPPPIVPGSTGEISGEVVDEAGDPVPNAIVYIRSGLEDVRFAPRQDAMQLTGSRDGMNHPPVVVQARQPLRLRSTDGMLHTLAGMGSDRRLKFNLPLLWGQRAPTVAIDRAVGEVSGRCTVHAHLHNEPNTRVIVLHHPYFTRTDHLGRFTLRDVPGDTDLELAVALAEADAQPMRLHLEQGGHEVLRLTSAEAR